MIGFVEGIRVQWLVIGVHRVLVGGDTEVGYREDDGRIVEDVENRGVSPIEIEVMRETNCGCRRAYQCVDGTARLRSGGGVVPRGQELFLIDPDFDVQLGLGLTTFSRSLLLLAVLRN